MILKLGNTIFSNVLIDNKDVNKIDVSNKSSFGEKDFKYFLVIKMLKMLNFYAYSFQKWVPKIEEILIKLKACVFWEKVKKLSEKWNQIWKNVSSIIKEEFDSKPVYNEKCIKTKTKSYNGKVNTNFHNNKITKEDVKV